ncbi:MAG: PQQ-binding-like beta-propeller repeat protein [Rubripirellula sp.]
MSIRSFCVSTSVCAFACLCISPVAQADWLRFRGPNGSGISADSAATSTKWSSKEGVKWKAELPGAGVSSPVIVGDRVFVTCYSGYGLDRQDPGTLEDLKRHVVCLSRLDGKVQWTKTIEAVQPEDPFAGMGVPAHGYASHTPVSDGENLYVFMGKSGVLAFDFEGKELWRTSVGTESDPKRWGSASSPILHENLVIVVASAESRSVVGLDKKTGKEVWKQETDGVTDVWGTPLLVETEGRTDLVLGVPYEFWGLNPETGKLRWYSEAMDSDSYNSSVVEADGVIYGIEGRGGGSAAVKAGGKGDTTEKNTIWTGNDSARFGSPLVVNGHIYYFSNGVATCIKASDGEEVFKGRLPGGTAARGGDGGRPQGRPGGDGNRPPEGRADAGGRGGFGGGFGGRGGGFGGRGGGGGGFGSMDYASPVSADGKIYYVKSDGTTHVINASDEFELLASNKVTEDKETFAATPAISNGQVFLRSDKHLYCIGE